MPRDLETFTTCAGPGTARPHTQLGGLAGFIISAWYFSGTLTIIGGLAFLFGLIWASSPFAYAATAIAIIFALTEIKHWYYHERLLCIRDPECTIGTVISEPTAAFDGDRKLNLMLAPFTQLQINLELIDHLDRNRGWLTTFPSAPSMPTKNQMAGNPSIFKNYMSDLNSASSNMYNQVNIGLVDTLMLDGAKNFFNRFYRKDSAHIPSGSATWNAIPTDHDTAVNWQGNDARSVSTLNPMFRFDSGPLVPYLHCEIEGNYIEILLNDFIVALTAFAASVGVLTAVLGPVFGPLAALFLAFLAWLIKKFVDWVTGNDGDAAEPDIDWDDPDFTGYGDVTETTGDVVVVHGNWIMDTEHEQYFEIHPVRAYYLVVKNELGDDAPVLVSGNEDQVVVGDNFDPTKVDADTAGRICKIIAAAEAQDPDRKTPVTGAAALSYGLMTKY